MTCGFQNFPLRPSEKINVGLILRRSGFKPFSSSALGLVLCALVAPQLYAQPALETDTVANASAVQGVYDPHYFNQFQPRTAYDMVVRIPGFNLQEDHTDERGFGQATLNILINGRRPSSKSSSANDILGRIPADTVTHIKIIDGASLDIPGLSGQVADIVVSVDNLSGNWRYAARFEEGTEPQLLEGAANFSGKRGNLEYTIGLEAYQFTFTEEGPEYFYDGTGTLIQNRYEDAALQQQQPRANINLTLNRPNSDVANLNISGAILNQNEFIHETFSGINNAAPSGDSVGRNGVDRHEFEIGGDYATPINLWGDKGQFKFIGLYSETHTDSTRRFFFDADNAPLTLSTFLRDDFSSEYIGRAEYTWSQGNNQDWALSAEAAFNRLESDTELFIDSGPRALDHVEVEESRYQANITQSWALTPQLNIQTSLGAEYSEINVPTSDDAKESFFRPKGFLSASYTVSPTYVWRGKIERSVGQLDFGTYVSTVSLTEGSAKQGNATVPDQRWKAELELERQDSKALSGKIKGFINFIDDPLDNIPILLSNGSIVEGPANLDSATTYGVSANLTWILDSIGGKGMRLSMDGQIADSRIEDPVTFENRSLNSTLLWYYEVELRQDIPGTSLAWEVELEQSRNSELYRVSEVFDTRFIRPEASLAFIHKDLLGLKWALTLSNLLDFKAQRNRQVFSTNRAETLIRQEEFNRQRGRRVSLEISDTF